MYTGTVVEESRTLKPVAEPCGTHGLHQASLVGIAESSIYKHVRTVFYALNLVSYAVESSLPSERLPPPARTKTIEHRKENTQDMKGIDEERL